MNKQDFKPGDRVIIDADGLREIEAIVDYYSPGGDEEEYTVVTNTKATLWGSA